MKIKPLSLLLLVALGLFSLLGCGGEEGSGSPEAGGGEVASPGEPAGDDAIQLGSGESADVQAFLQDYEELIDKYCDFAERFSTASVMEMAELGQEMAAQGMEMTEYSGRVIAMKASFSPRAEERLEALEKKAEGCAEKIGG